MGVSNLELTSIMYKSTNLSSKPVTFREALIKGQAPDKGLYMPDSIPKINRGHLAFMKALPYHEVAFEVTKKFLQGEIPEKNLRAIVKDAYDYEVPLENVDEKRYIMRLDRGPTASFKDFAARMMARLMQYYLKQENKKLVILVATSGDTGSAVANAFYGLENIEVVVLFPGSEVSERQRKQMTTLGRNIFAFAVYGKFDDCQALVKQAFADPDLQNINLSSANSINFGRLLPQAVYYFYAYSRLFRDLGEPIIFSVPSGNFGDLMGGVLAREMGLPISKFIVATNENDEFPMFMRTKSYAPICPSKECLSNAMNVGHPSNLARLFYLYNGNMDEKGAIVRLPNIRKMRQDFDSISISDAETKETIKQAYQKYKVILEPHGAVAWAALDHFDPDGLCVSLETAHPAKFPSVIKETIGIDPKLPESMKGIENKKEEFQNLKNDYPAFKEFLKQRFGPKS